jgi:predicted kinase
MNEDNGKLIMLRGLPASGKSTWAKEQVEKNVDTYRINKDDLRAMLKGSVWNRSLEATVIELRDSFVTEMLVRGNTVIVDDTNFNNIHVRRLRQIASQTGASFEIIDFNTPLEVCLERNRLREKPVPEEVILRMHEDFVKNSPKKLLQDPEATPAVVVDLDGTLAIHTNRSPFEFHKCYSDAVNEPVLACVKALEAAGNAIVFVSGREDSCRAETQRWLKDKCGLKNCPLFMRKTGDHRKDAVIKEEIYKNSIIPEYYVKFVLDDRDQVVNHLRDLGLTVFQVAPGNF